MTIWQSFRLAAKSIISNKMRSLLTMLGMIIGVGSVIIIMGLMSGVTDYIVSSFADMGTNMITVNITNTGTRTVTVDDMYAFADKNTDVFEGVTPSVSGNFTLKNGTSSLSTTVTGAGEDYDEINHITLTQGRFVSYADILKRQSVCVVGTYIVNELFENNNVLGETIKIDGENFQIIGIVEETAEGEENSADECVYIPYSKAARMTFTGKISSFTFAAHDTDYVEAGEELLDSYLYEVFADEDLYRITSMTVLLDTINSMTDMLGMVLSGIAGISLLVAGIGIMNIMLVSVTERTKEIGIRKSLGARKKDIMQQFIIEAGTISALGGLLGIIFGSSLTIYLGKSFGVNAAPSFGSVMMSFSISAGIGILFGYIPAKKAANLNPIDALRSD